MIDGMLMSFPKLKKAIFAENKRQLKKWGVQDHNMFTWLAFAMEEVGETSAAMADYIFRDGPIKNISKEAIQVATLFLKIAEMIDMALEEK